MAAAGITAVAVLSTHRRQGHLTRLMRSQLDAIADEQIPVALLVAAEWPIYGRFGYGPADRRLRVRDRRRRRPGSGTRPPGRSSWSTPPTLRPALEAAHEARRAAHPGRHPPGSDGVGPHRRRQRLAGSALRRRRAARARSGVTRRAPCRGRSPTRSTTRWTRNRPAGRAEVGLLVGATPEAERELWRHLCEIDWVQTVSAGNRGIDDPLPLFLEDGRAAVALDHFDCIWARILDVPAALGGSPGRAGRPTWWSRSPTTSGFADGPLAASTSRPTGPRSRRRRRRLTSCCPAARSVPCTSAGGRPRRLHEAGWLDEGSPGGVARLDATLRTATAPWSPTTY